MYLIPKVINKYMSIRDLIAHEYKEHQCLMCIEEDCIFGFASIGYINLAKTHTLT